MLVRCNAEQLDLFKAEKLGTLPLDVAEELLEHAKTVRTLPTPDKRIVEAALTDYVNALRSGTEISP